MREPHRCVAGSDRGSDDASTDGDVEPGADHDGGADRDAITHSESDGRRRIAQSHRDQCPGERDPESFAGCRRESAGHRRGQRNELPALRDAHRDRLPRSALALPVPWGSAPLGLADLHKPRDEQRNRLDEVVEEMQVRSRDRKTAEEQTA